MNTANGFIQMPKIPKVIQIALAILLIYLMASVMGCSVAKKDTSAVNRVLGNVVLQDRVMNAYFLTHPPTRDTILGPVQFLPGKKDTVKSTVQITKFKAVDTIMSGVHLTVDTSGLISLFVPNQKPDTVYQPKYIKDFAELARVKDSLQKARDESAQWQLQASNLKGQLAQKNIDDKKEIDDITAAKNMWMWIVIGIGAAVIGFTAFKLFYRATPAGAASGVASSVISEAEKLIK